MAHKNDTYQHDEDDCCDTTKKVSITPPKKYEGLNHDKHDHEEKKDDHESEGDESLLKSRWTL